MTFRHIPVMLQDVLAWLAPRKGGVYLDGTLGGGGHSEAILRAIDGGTLFGIDRDRAALAAASERLRAYPGFHAIQGNFHDAKELLPDIRLDGALLDLGVSSPQLDTPERGFSYHEDAPLDMRMDASAGETAADWLKNHDENEIERALYEYGDERWAKRIARFIKECEKTEPVRTTYDLVGVIDRAIPKAVRQKDDGHPARRTFQALRIAVNDELDPLAGALDDIAGMLRPGGRFCVITFHSIEDRIVKRAFQKMQNPCVCPPKAPICVCGRKPVAKVLAGGAVKPSQEEVSDNPRARSAKLRVIERV